MDLELVFGKTTLTVLEQLKRKHVIWVSLLVASAVTAGTMLLVIGLPIASPCSNVHSATRSFTIIADQNGYNASKNMSPPWPVLSVGKCDRVTIRLVNEDIQAHGLAVDTYYVKGLSSSGGETLTLNFVAATTGQFRVFCTIYCTVHLFMQNGLLNVS